ncbi:MAG: hypothetical protein AB7T06_46455 [Kofleriaceae bacterium]
MRTGLSLIAIACVIGCAAPRRDDGSGGGDDQPGTDSAVGGADCADGTELVYTIDQFNSKLSTFDPSTKTFHDLGSLQCPVTAGGTPFSMSVDRAGNAWVLYNNGELFKVGIQGLGCTMLTWTPPSGLHVFGMGFSTDMAGGETEQLYIGGGLTQMQTSYLLARVDPTTMTATTFGSQPQLPEMTGNGNAELWGFMPEATTARVVQFDKTTGAVTRTFMQPTLGGTNTAYAFAHWGGDYWVFLQRNAETNTTVYQVDGMNGTIKSMTPAVGHTVVGAGVSTCAPLVLL